MECVFEDESLINEVNTPGHVPRKRSTPSPSVVFRYVWAFHPAEQQGLRRAVKPFIPGANEHVHRQSYPDDCKVKEQSAPGKKGKEQTNYVLIHGKSTSLMHLILGKNAVETTRAHR